MQRRRAYSYVRKDGRVVHVPATTIGPLKKGLLKKYGYSTFLPDAERRRALRRAVEHLGLRHVERALIAASTYSKRRAPRASSIMKANEHYLSRT
jgi:Family of unknown function (DUF5771)